MEEQLRADVCIIGGGPGGCATALQLAKHGADVLLLEKAAFPRDKVCGDALSGKVVRSLLQTTAGGTSAYQTLSDIGIALQPDGTLKLDSSKLTKAIEADYAGVTALVSKVGTAFKDGIEGLAGTSGTITAATDSTNRLIKELGKRQTALLDRLEQVESRYRKQFSALDSLVASMNKTSSYLTQQLANLPGASSN